MGLRKAIIANRLGVLGLVIVLGVPMILIGASRPALAASFARTWYVSGHGDDTADGRSVGSSWRTLSRVNQQRLAPGDTVLLEGGATFVGTLRLDATDAASASTPVRVSSYGSGRASILSSGDSGIVIYDTAGVDISDLQILGSTRALHSAAGVNAYNDLPGDRKLAHLHIARVEVSGFQDGIAVGGGLGASGFSDVAVLSADLHDNLNSGLIFYGPSFRPNAPIYAHAQVLVSDVHAYDNHGDPSQLAHNTGNGIVLGSVQGALVKRSQANGNGDACRAADGPVGIWTYDSDSVTIEQNVSDHNRSAGLADGDGFDLDQNVSRSVLQGNLSFANDGAGYLVYTAAANGAHRDNVVRFNVSVGDGARLAWLGAITVWGQMTGTRIEQNTVVVRATPGGRPPALRLQAGLTGVLVRNNVLFSDGGGPLVEAVQSSAAGVLLQDNDYFARGGPWSVRWGANTYNSLVDWRAATGQETRRGQATGTTVDPELRDPGVAMIAAAQARAPRDVPALTGIILTANSPVRTFGLPLPAAPQRVGARPGVFDVFGDNVDLTRPVALGADQPGP